MTQKLGALGCLLDAEKADTQLAAFYEQWKGDRLVMDKWFALQASRSAPEKSAAIVKKLTQHPDFEWKNPNRFRSVIGGLAMNPAAFHDPSGASYELVADWLIRLDPLNPQTTARMTTLFETWRRYDADRQAMMRTALTRIRNAPDLSRDVSEMVGRILGD